jgi:hypothetical protein
MGQLPTVPLAPSCHFGERGLIDSLQVAEGAPPNMEKAEARCVCSEPAYWGARTHLAFQGRRQEVDREVTHAEDR